MIELQLVGVALAAVGVLLVFGFFLWVGLMAALDLWRYSKDPVGLVGMGGLIALLVGACTVAVTLR